MTAEHADSVEAIDKRLNEVLAAGAMWAALAISGTARVEAEPVMDEHGQATPALWLWFPGILDSRYRCTIEIDPEPDEANAEHPASIGSLSSGDGRGHV